MTNEDSRPKEQGKTFDEFFWKRWEKYIGRYSNNPPRVEENDDDDDSVS